MYIRIALAFLACLLTILAFKVFAKPAPWYLWQSRLDGHRICLQHAPGESWIRLSGPYTNLQCDTPLRSGSGR